MLKKHFLNKTKTTQRFMVLLVVLVVAGIGTYLLTGSHAATPYASITADNGQLTNGALKQSCSGSTDGSCVAFGSTTAPSSPTGKLLGLNSSLDDVSTIGDPNVYKELDVNSLRADIELDGTSFDDPTYSGNIGNYIDTVTSEHITPLPMLNEYVEMDTINVSQFVTATVNWCQAYCAGGTFYSASSQASQSTKANATYAPQVLEILNEPYGNWWGYPVTTTDVNAYATLLKAIRVGLNNAGLTNISILAAANDNNGGTRNWNTMMVSNGGFAAAQGVTEHPYGPVDTSCSPSTSTTNCTVTSGDTSGSNTDGWGLVYYAHQFLTSNGLSAQANNIYVTEVGYCTTATPDPCSGGNFSETVKDQDISAIIGQLAGVSWLKSIEYFNLMPYQDCLSSNSQGKCTDEVYNTYGFYNPPTIANPNAASPAWATYQAAAQANGL